MAFDSSNVTLVGGVTREPELRVLPNGTPILQLGVAVNHSRKVDGEWVDEPNFFDVTAFGTLAENVSESIEKGNRVIIVGKVTYRSWENQEGEKRSKVEIKAEAIGPDLNRATAAVTRVKREDG